MFFLSIVLTFGCAPIKLQVTGGPVGDMNRVKSNEIVLIGRFEIIPALKDSERHLKSSTFTNAHKDFLWIVKGDKWLNTKDYDIYNGYTGGNTFSMNMTNHAPVYINNKLSSFSLDKENKKLLISGGYFLAGESLVNVRNTKGSVSKEMAFFANHLNFKLDINTNKKSRALYIGDIKLYRDKNMNIKNIVVKDNYKSANAEYKKTYKVTDNLKKSLARIR